MAHNMYKNEYKKNEIKQRADAELKHNDIYLSESDSLENQMESFRKALLEKLDFLELEKKEAFIMRYLENFSIKEISEILQKPEGTIKSGLHYSCKKLSVALEPFKK